VESLIDTWIVRFAAGGYRSTVAIPAFG